MADWLRVIGTGDRLDVDADLTIGREEPGLGSLSNDEELSRQHARFTRTETGGLRVEDLGSSNGTFVNDKRLQSADLRPGDVVLLGSTKLEVVAGAATKIVPTPTPEPGGSPTRVREIPEPEPPPQQTPPAASPQPATPTPTPAATSQGPVVASPGPAAARPPATPHPLRSSSEAPPPRRSGLGILAFVVLLILGVLAAVLLVGGDDDEDGEEGAPAAVGTEAPYLGTVYSLSNRPEPNANSVIAIRYGENGFEPLFLREYPTGGSGSAGAEGGPLDGDQQLEIDLERRLLFAVNQGSDSIAVFRIADDGSLTAVEGSPFPSGGTAPISVGVSEDTVIVVNKGIDGVRKILDPGSVAQFTLGEDGSLTPVGTPVRIEPGTVPSQAMVIDRADLVVVPEFGAGFYRTLLRDDQGTFSEGPTTPVTNAQRKIGPSFLDSLTAVVGEENVPEELPPPPLGAQGLSVHPEQDLLYSTLSATSTLMIHSFDASGTLNFVTGVPIEGGFLACWSVVSPTGDFLYTSNAGTHTVSVFDLADPRNPLQVQSLALGGGGGHAFNLEIDASGERLFVVDTFEPAVDPPGLGNQVHVLDIGPDGQLSIPKRGALAKFPVTLGTSSFGLGVVEAETAEAPE